MIDTEKNLTVTYKLLTTAVKFFGLKRIKTNEPDWSKYINKSKELNSKEYKKPQLSYLDCKYHEFVFNNMKVFYINEKNNKQQTILYLHGGAYIGNPNMFHFNFLNKIVNGTDYKIIMPIYPKTPEFDAEYCYDILFDYIKYQNLTNFILMGDSAGGGLCVGFAKFLETKKLNYITKMILISPWLDINTDNPEIKKIEKYDNMLSSIVLNKIGKIWCNKLNSNNYKVSPINAKFVNPIETQIYIGTYDILYPDCVKFNENNSNLIIDLKIYNKLSHVFPLYPLNEVCEPISDMIKFLKQKQ